ncbi:hypothetical protein [Salibacterium aidingense]|uniref:hypothetical protein n=1 Tax=Salibacterium aidingense TaxID=384933 RepID=UPI00047CDC14|nr:hypothetical protein [Salibacterium aidingense]
MLRHPLQANACRGHASATFSLSQGLGQNHIGQIKIRTIIFSIRNLASFGFFHAASALLKQPIGTESAAVQSLRPIPIGVSVAGLRYDKELLSLC